MTLDEITKSAIDPALTLLPAAMDKPQARVMMLAIGLQESRFIHREQIGGPARGFWQFEKGGGVKGVMNHPLSSDLAKKICQARDVLFDRTTIYNTLAKDDVLAAAFARLLLWTDPKSLPGKNDSSGGWDLYNRVWRPGKPHPQTWGDFYQQALKYVYGE